VDVQIALVEARVPAQSTDVARSALEHLLERIDGRRDEVQAYAQRRLRKVKRRDLGVGVAAALGEVVARLPASSTEAAQLAWKLLEPLVEGVEQHDKDVGSASTPTALHELRISIKKLRYALELVAPLLGADQRELIKRAESLQELLGTHHDLFVIAGLMDDERRKLEERGRKTLPFGLTVLRGELEAEERDLVQRFEATRAAPGYFREKIQAALSRA
jgi:CHAD domain-containing protein